MLKMEDLGRDDEMSGAIKKKKKKNPQILPFFLSFILQPLLELKKDVVRELIGIETLDVERIYVSNCYINVRKNSFKPFQLALF